MARISLLFSLALVLAIGSVSAHPPSHKKTQKTLCPPTLSGLQSYPFFEISKLVEKKAHQTVHETAQFKILFAICKGYSDYLGSFQKFSGSKDVFRMVHAKFSLMSNKMLDAQAVVGVEGNLRVKLSKSYVVMAQGFVELPEKIAEISAKYKFKGDAKISQSDRTKIDNCLIKLKGSIRVFLKVISEISKKCSAEKKKPDFEARIGGGGFIGAFVKQGRGYGGKFIGLDGHGQVNAGAIVGAQGGAKAGAQAGAEVGGKVGAHAGGKIGAHAGGKIKAHAGGKIGAHAGGKIGAHAGGKIKAHAGGKIKAHAGGKIKAHAGGKIKAHAGGKIKAQAGGKVGAHAGGKVGGFLGFGGKVQFDAAGKAKVGGGNGFRSLSHSHSKHLV